MKTTTKPSWRPVILYLVALSLMPGDSSGGQGTFTPIDVPGAVETNAHGINNKGDIVGGYALPGENCNLPFVGPPCPHSFLLSNGQFSTFDIEGATFTFFSRINSRGDIVGWYGTPDDPDGVVHGFLLTGWPRGEYEFTSIDFSDTLTVAAGINDQGDTVGGYVDGEGVQYGYLLTGWPGSEYKFTTIDVAGVTTATGINDQGDIVGGRNPGYLLTGWPGSEYELTWIVFPGAILTNSNTLNNHRDIVGRYDTADGATHGYLWSGGEFRFTIDFPGAPNWTSAIAINDQGDIVGKYKDADGKFHGYLLSRECR